MRLYKFTNPLSIQTSVLRTFSRLSTSPVNCHLDPVLLQWSHSANRNQTQFFQSWWTFPSLLVQGFSQTHKKLIFWLPFRRNLRFSLTKFFPRHWLAFKYGLPCCILLRNANHFTFVCIKIHRMGSTYLDCSCSHLREIGTSRYLNQVGCLFPSIAYKRKLCGLLICRCLKLAERKPRQHIHLQSAGQGIQIVFSQWHIPFIDHLSPLSPC